MIRRRRHPLVEAIADEVAELGPPLQIDEKGVSADAAVTQASLMQIAKRVQALEQHGYDQIGRQLSLLFEQQRQVALHVLQYEARYRGIPVSRPNHMRMLERLEEGVFFRQLLGQVRLVGCGLRLLDQVARPGGGMFAARKQPVFTGTNRANPFVIHNVPYGRVGSLIIWRAGGVSPLISARHQGAPRPPARHIVSGSNLFSSALADPG